MTEHHNSEIDPYASIVSLYDLEHDDFFDDIDLLLQLAETGSTPILELGCGTGRVLQALVDSEIEVTGIDRSAHMLDAAVHRLSTSAHGALATLIEGDIRTPAESVATQFGMVAYTLNALMHLSSTDDQLLSLSSTKETLVPGGVVFIDIMNPHPEQLMHLGGGVILEGSWTIEDGQIVDKWSHRTIHPADQIIATDIWYDTITQTGELRRLKTSFDHRYIHASELRLMLERSGFVDIVLYGSYELDPFDDDSDRLIALAKRPLA